MKRPNMIEAMALNAGISKKEAEEALKTFEGLVSETLVVKGEYQILGIGTLKVKKRAARNGRNPKTGDPIQIAESKAVTFSASKTIKDRLNP